MAAGGKIFAYEARLDAGGGYHEGDAPLAPAGWSAEGLVLAGLMRCSLHSLRHYATKAGFTVVEASARARGTVAKREEDGRYAFTEVELEVEAGLEPAPGVEQARELAERAEWGCFVGASLVAKPRYTWRIS